MSASQPDPERRWYPVVTIGPYLLLAVLAAFTVVMKRAQGASPAGDLALCGLAAAWMLWMFTLHPAWRDRPAVMATFFTVLIGITAVLVVRAPWFGCFAPAAYLYAFRVLHWPWRLAGVAAVAVVAGTAQAAAVDKTTAAGLLGYGGILAVNALPMCGFAWFAWRSTQWSDQRDRALAEVREANRRLEVSLAENAALHQRLLAQAREAGVLDERQRMAREIHDTLAQGLTGIITQLQAAEQAGPHRAEGRRHLEAATKLARESLVEARRSVHALRPEPLSQAGLGEALAAVVRNWSARHGIAAEAGTTGTVRPIPPATEDALLRAAQEALANVARHAEASRVGVTLSFLDSEVALDVRDDGRGFDPAVPAAGFGLLAMRQRIDGLSGTVRIESEPGAGTAVSARVPLAKEVPA
ncbi:sensor histidine kinase [Amycolatopsis rhizosphaerae]|uniref:Oxygen sensor histidine kinase NreB n=1 Tax=Amycolatopsis rhizosphaerae TaxID=2053003 RepID=A0A558B324_9PSEU|nr:sensor histidine kinase [Amycolatopsis rhizosphaerae]TVT30916.1 sensor histidine kinase [Amycolatopsis rhizosphaerae]